MAPFEELVAEHGAVVWRVCRALLGPHDADDAWSEAFLSALRAYPDLRPDSNVRGWLVTIAHRKAIDVHRGRARRPVVVGALPEAPATEPHAEELDEDLAAALAELAPKQRQAVVYHHLAGLPYAEVGATMGISTGAARRNAADGIAALRRRFPAGITSSPSGNI